MHCSAQDEINREMRIPKNSMPKLACRCGFVHNLSSIPDDGWVTVLDRDLEAFVDAELKACGNSDINANSIALTGSLYECPQCGRVMWAKPGERQFITYCRES